MRTSSAKCRDPGNASPLKLRVARIVASDRAGRFIGAMSGNRVRHHGLWFDVRSSDFSPQVRAQMFWGGYEGAETRMIRGLLPGSTTVVELGSSLGVTSGPCRGADGSERPPSVRRGQPAALAGTPGKASPPLRLRSE